MHSTTAFSQVLNNTALAVLRNPPINSAPIVFGMSAGSRVSANFIDGREPTEWFARTIGPGYSCDIGLREDRSEILNSKQGEAFYACLQKRCTDSQRPEKNLVERECRETICAALRNLALETFSNNPEEGSEPATDSQRLLIAVAYRARAFQAPQILQRLELAVKERFGEHFSFRDPVGGDGEIAGADGWHLWALAGTNEM